MKNVLIGFMMLFLGTVALADERYLDAYGLNEQQKAEIALQIAKLKSPSITENAQNVSAKTRQEAEAWGEMGANMGKALVSAAKEIGVAANDFAQTPLGKITVAVVVYKLIGHDVIDILVGGSILFIFLSLAAYVIIKFRWGAEIKYEYKPKLFGLYQKRYISSIREDAEAAGGRLIVAGVLILIGLITGLNIIF